MTHKQPIDVTEFEDFRSTVFSQLKVAHGWSGFEADLTNMNLDAIEVCTRFAWIEGGCPFCTGSIIAGMAGLEIKDEHIMQEH